MMLRLSKKVFRLCLMSVFVGLTAFPATLCADGLYRILQDENGVYFQAETGESWYAPEEDLVYFKPGQSGSYRAGNDPNGRFIQTDQGKFYLGPNDDGVIERDIEDFNRC